MDKNNQNYQYIGKLDPNIAKYWKLEEQANKSLLLFLMIENNILLINI